MYRILGADGRQYGPVNADQLRTWIADGRACAQTLVQVEGTDSWKPLSAFPEFAAVTPQPTPVRTPPTFASEGAHPLKNCPMAVAGFVCGLIGLTCCGGALLSVLGLVFSILGLMEINRDPRQFTGKSLAVAGIVLSALGLLLFALVILGGVSGEMLKGIRHHRRWLA